MLGDRGFRVDLPPSLGVPLQQRHAKVILNGTLGSYRLVLAARFEAYLTWRHAGDPARAAAKVPADLDAWS